MINDLRRKVLIQPRLQKKIIFQFCLLGVAMIFVNLVSFYFLVNKVITHLENMNRVSPEIYDVVMDSWSYLTLSTLVLSLLLILGFCLYGLVFSNRIAGPIYNLRKAIAQILMGEKNVRIKFRKDDYFHELSEDMNVLIEKFSPKD